MKIEKAIQRAVKNQCSTRKATKFRRKSCTVYLVELVAGVTARDAADANLHFAKQIHASLPGPSHGDYIWQRTKTGLLCHSYSDTLSLKMRLAGTVKKPRVNVTWKFIKD